MMDQAYRMQGEALDETFNEMSHLRLFPGAPEEFWPAFLKAAALLSRARHAVLLVKDPQKGANWRRLGQWAAQPEPDRESSIFTRHLAEIGDRCARAGAWHGPLGEGESAGAYGLAILLRLHRGNEISVAAFLVGGVSAEVAKENLTRLRLVADVPASYQASLSSRRTEADVERLTSTLDLSDQVNAATRFYQAALAFCNGVAAQRHCDRVSLGWVEGGYIRLRAISRTEQFNRQMAAAKAIEVAMEESLDQDEEVVWPAPVGVQQVTRDHEAYARQQSSGHLCSIPLRLNRTIEGVLMCERSARPFDEVEVRQLRLACQQVAPRLSDLKRRDRWFGARWSSAARERLARWVGVEHTWAKVVVVLIAVALVSLFLVRPIYRVEAQFNLRSDQISYLTAPFDGYIAEVPVRVGEAVRERQPLLTLAQDDLLLEEAAAVADLSRYRREAEKSRAAGALADMRIAQALADQANARLELVRHRLNQASLSAPFDGMLVEGEMRERVGAPVKQGDVLFKVARTDGLYVEAEVNERDVHEVRPEATGEIAFATQPDRTYPVRVVRVRPAAQPKEGANVFVVRCAVSASPDSWWRPGMSGVCKINVERRSLLWILTHRTVDYLRLLLWW